jgi:TrmH family RNA methyltransferase
VVEGAELLSVALAAGNPIEAVYVAPEGRTNPSVAAVVDRVFATGVRVFDLAPGVIERVADTVTPQPVLAVVGFATAALEDIKGTSMIVVCVDVRDPGNVGTMIRTADATGVGAVVCCEGSVDPTNPKTVRSSAGSLFHVPIVAGGAPDAVLDALRGWGFTTVGTRVRGGLDYAAFDWKQKVAAVFGNEASGLGPSVADSLDAAVSIPMVGQAESLNVGVSAAVLCFEALRQRRAEQLHGVRDAHRPTMPDMGSAPTSIQFSDDDRPPSGGEAHEI